MSDAIAQMLAAGFPAPLLIPCLPHSVRQAGAGKAPCRVTAEGEWVGASRWQLGLAEQELIAAGRAGANCGIRLGALGNGRQFVFIDIDTQPDENGSDTTTANNITEIAIDTFRASLGYDAIWVRRTQPGRAGILIEMPEGTSAGQKFVARMHDPKKGRFLGAIELLAAGQQAVVAGTHRYGGGTPIRWYRTDRPDLVHDVPMLDDALPRIRSRDALNAILRQIIAELESWGYAFGVRANAASITSSVDLPPEEISPPSTQHVVRAFNDMPHDGRISRDAYVQLMRCAAGCIRAMGLRGKMSPEEIDSIQDAAIRWAARWDDLKGVGTTEDAEREKWHEDFLRNPATRVPCWEVIAGYAIRLGNQELRDEQVQAEFEGTDVLPAAGITATLPPPLSTDPTAVASSEDALAMEFSRRYAGQVVCIANGRGWHRWNGHLWAVDDKKAVFDLARLVCRDHARRLESKESESLARRISSAATRSAVVSIAAADPRHARSIGEFDTDLWILNTPGGVVDLRTGEIRPHRNGEAVTKSTPVAPGGDCPLWIQFLSQATNGDQDLVAYLQRWFGYSLTGSTVEQQFLFLYGPGGNGKSVITQTLAAAMGTYATTATPDVFTAAHSEQHLAHVASLHGARMVMAPETEEGKAWAEARLKALVAADRQSARFMRGDPFEFTPILKLWVCGNHLPRLTNVDDAMRRRTRIVHLTHRPSAPDPFLADRLKAELGGILAWGIQGCLDWQRQRLGMPETVRQACDDYFLEQDALTAWVTERLDQSDPEASEGSRALFANWRDFARARGEDPRSETWFGPEMLKRFTRKHTSTGKRFFGVSLKPDPSEFEAVLPP